MSRNCVHSIRKVETLRNGNTRIMNYCECGHAVPGDLNGINVNQQCRLDKSVIRPTYLSQVDCIHLVGMGEGEAEGCCGGGPVIVDLGNCEIHGPCTINGTKVGGITTHACRGCTDRPVVKHSPDS